MCRIVFFAIFAIHFTTLIASQRFSIQVFFLENGLAAINDLEKHLEDIDIQPKPEAQYVVYNRVPKVSKRFRSLYDSYEG